MKLHRSASRKGFIRTLAVALIFSFIVDPAFADFPMPSSSLAHFVAQPDVQTAIHNLQSPMFEQQALEVVGLWFHKIHSAMNLMHQLRLVAFRSLGSIYLHVPDVFQNVTLSPI